MESEKIAMRRTASFAVFALLLGWSSLGLAASDSPAAKVAPSEKAKVEAATKDFHDALRANELERFMHYVADDVVFMPPGEAPSRGKEAVRAWMVAFLGQYRTTTLTLADREVFVGDGFAVELGTYDWGLAPTAGGAATVDRGNYMQVWTKDASGQWRFAREIYNSSVPPAAPPAP